jgi:hypothetical protein
MKNTRRKGCNNKHTSHFGTILFASAPIGHRTSKVIPDFPEEVDIPFILPPTYSYVKSEPHHDFTDKSEKFTQQLLNNLYNNLS